MPEFTQMLNIQLGLIVYLLAGVISYHANIITEKNRPQFIDFILYILMPSMVFQSFKNVTPKMLTQGLIALFISLAICVLSSFLGKVIYAKIPHEKRLIMRYATLINNAGFAGLPIISEMYGSEGLLLASIFLIPIRIFMWSSGITILSGSSSSLKKVFVKLLKNPSIIAVFLGLLRGLFQIPLPYFLDNSLSSLSKAVSPLAMIAIGSIIATISITGLLDKFVLYYASIRLLFLPLLVFFALNTIGIPKLIIGVSLILTSMPAATTTALLTASYDGDVTFASKLVFVTTILSVVTSPLLMLLL